jgi:mono/diheme cytochrome c family protein
MYPRPRDYRRGIFKFTSTPYGAKPLRADLVRTVMRGVPGTSMPAFKLLPREDVEATVDYVLALTLRGELEEQVAITAEAEEEIDPLTVQDETLPYLVSNWKQASQQEVRPVTPQPEFTREHVQRGREAFLTKGCSKCHGDDGRGLTADNLKAGLKDVWGFPTRAADLTSGMLRGGFEPEDVYRRIYSGINGTPMPAFSTTLAAEPDTLWDLVAYVLHVSGTRRRGAIPVPPPFLPYVPADAVSEGG